MNSEVPLTLQAESKMAHVLIASPHETFCVELAQAPTESHTSNAPIAAPSTSDAPTTSDQALVILKHKKRGGGGKFVKGQSKPIPKGKTSGAREPTATQFVLGHTNMSTRSGLTQDIAEATCVPELKVLLKKQARLLKDMEVTIVAQEEQLVVNQKEMARLQEQLKYGASKVNKQVKVEVAAKVQLYKEQVTCTKAKLATAKLFSDTLEKKIKDAEKQKEEGIKEAKKKAKSEVKEVKAVLQSQYESETKDLNENWASKVIDLEKKAEEVKSTEKQKYNNKIQSMKDGGQVVQQFRENATSNTNNLTRNLIQRSVDFTPVLKKVPVEVLAATLKRISAEEKKDGIKEEESYFSSLCKTPQFENHRVLAIEQV